MNGSPSPSDIAICHSALKLLSQFGTSLGQELRYPLEAPPFAFLERNGMILIEVDAEINSSDIDRALRRGKHRLLLWPDQEADGSVDSTTPSKVGTRDEMGRLEKVRVVEWTLYGLLYFIFCSL
jgi:hypothetical protein